MDFTPPPIVAEMQAMKEQTEVMMNALKGRVSSDLDDLVNRTDSPFTATVNSYPLPKEDARRLYHPHDDALVVNLRVEDYNMHRVLVDNGSSADILYYPAFQQMRIDRERLVPTNAPLVGFGGSRVFPLGAVTLSVIVGDYLQQIVKDVTFLVVDCSSAYNAILRRPTLNS
ncbi:uncharacterized protein LOC115980207 [Quercus lobata]|uniref:uncharacterized protein LOC115980207 n=1 Tax=Quercus lobata TaxID=97700 RepID=UPI0012472BF2|nr:uncharacterized protein LOC115980207 [Quercus lobata]